MVPVSGQNQVQKTPRESRKPKRERIQGGDTWAHRANVAQGPGGCQEARLGSGGSGWRQELCRDSGSERRIWQAHAGVEGWRSFQYELREETLGAGVVSSGCAHSESDPGDGPK